MYKISVPTVITNGHFQKEKTLSEIRRAGAERIVLALDRELPYAFSSDENLALLKELIEYYEENGLEVIVWLGETLGHDGSPISERGRYTPIRCFSGGDTKAFCPLDEDFIRDFQHWVRAVARAGAKMIMLDDDFRLGYRGGIGCACDLHMKAICEELGEDISREELYKNAFSGGAGRYRDAWLKVQGDSLKNFARKLREALDEINPACRLSFCACVDSWGTSSTDAPELARIFAGGTAPFLRTIGAPYWSNRMGINMTLAEVVAFERCELGWLKEESKGKQPIECFTEGDTYPRPRFAVPASYLECFDQILRADGRADGCLKYMLDYVSDADYETGYIDAMLRSKPIYEALEREFAPKKATGVRLWNTMHKLRDAELDASRPRLDIEVQEGLFDAAFYFANRNSLSASDCEEDVNVIFGENARKVPLSVLKNGSMIDLPAARLLMARGVDVGIASLEAEICHQPGGFSDMPQEYYPDENQYTRLSAGVRPVYLAKKEGAVTLTQFVANGRRFDGVYHYENANGERFLVFPFNAEDAKCALGWFDHYCRKRLVDREIAWLGRKAADAVICGNHPMLYLMTKRDGDALAVGVWNLSADRVDALRVRLCSAGEDIRFINCSGQMENDTVALDTVLYPYEFAGFTVKTH